MSKRSLTASKLGELETDVMNALWDGGEGSVEEVQGRLHKGLAYTTVMTVLTRLVDKGFLERQKRGRAFVYRPRTSRRSIADSALRRVVDRFFGGKRSLAVAHLLGHPEEIDEETLSRLESTVRARRRKPRG